MVLERFLWKGLNVKIVFVTVTVMLADIQMTQGYAHAKNVIVILRELK
jgi:hypothetical protein